MIPPRSSRTLAGVALIFAFLPMISVGGDADPLREHAIVAAKQAAQYFRGHVAAHGGYVYYYSVDLRQRWGEGPATKDQIWVQPPGTPTVGMAYLKMFYATGDRFYLSSSTEAAEALVYGQLQSGGWTNSIDFDRQGRVAQYRNGKGRGKNYSSLDDGQTPSALRLLVQVDKALEFEHQTIHEAAQYGLQALLAAQFPNGAFPQVWTGPVTPQPVLSASYPPYDWRTEGRVKNYWDMYTLNDNVCGYVAETLLEAFQTYEDVRYEQALRRLGDFLLLAQMPAPQPGWAQQYNYEMQPIWARKFEPPAVAGDESQEVVHTLIMIYHATGDPKYLQPIPLAIAYLKRSLLPSGQLARYYELRTNRPLYMKRRGDTYSLTYDDSRLPKHYGWKIESRLGQLEEAYRRAKGGDTEDALNAPREQQVRQIINSLDSRGFWIDTYQGEMLVGQPKFAPQFQYISSATFSDNLGVLSEYLTATDRR